MYFAEGFAGLSLLVRMDVWQHGTSRRRAWSVVKTVDSKVSVHELHPKLLLLGFQALLWSAARHGAMHFQW
jgi:hypothetical protein